MDVMNCWAILVAAIAAYILGAIWYSHYLFGKLWTQGAGVVPVQGASKHSFLVYIVSFFFYLIAAYVFALFLGPAPDINYAVTMGFAAGFGFVAMSFGVNYAFANRGIKLFLIDGGYHTAQFVLYGIIFGLWH